jgi:hypothetical protein
MPRQKLYCYIDESRQDDASAAFIVVAVVSDGDQDKLGEELVAVEDLARHASSEVAQDEYEATAAVYLELGIERKLADGEIFSAPTPNRSHFYSL